MHSTYNGSRVVHGTSEGIFHRVQHSVRPGKIRRESAFFVSNEKPI